MSASHMKPVEYGGGGGGTGSMYPTRADIRRRRGGGGGLGDQHRGEVGETPEQQCALPVKSKKDTGGGEPEWPHMPTTCSQKYGEGRRNPNQQCATHTSIQHGGAGGGGSYMGQGIQATWQAEDIRQKRSGDKWGGGSGGQKIQEEIGGQGRIR